MFRGLFPHVLDDKGRTSLPKGWRDLLTGSDDPWLTAKRDCLAIYPAAAFDEKVLGLVAAGERGVNAAEELLRLTSGYGMPCPIDRQGRILIPPSHKDWAQLEREIMFVGLNSHIEIWDRVLHAEALGRVRENYKELNDQVHPEIKEFKG